MAVIALLCATAVTAQSANVWIDVPFVKQAPEACGAATLAMVMRYWAQQQGREFDRRSDPEFIFAQLHSRDGHGIYASKMKSYLDRQGFQTFVFGGTWDDLKQHIAKGRPLIVELRPLRNGDALHYVVVAGIDEPQQLVIFNDPADRQLAKLDRTSFEKEWKATEQWTLLAVPRSNAP